MEQPRTHSNTTTTTTTTSSSPPPPPPAQSKTKSQVQESSTNNIAPSSISSHSSTGINSSSIKIRGRAHHFATTQDKNNEMNMDSDNGSKPKDVGTLQDEDTEMVGNDENNILSRDTMLVKEYTEGPSSIGITGGTITPHNSHFLNSDNENESESTNNLFKQFDPKTGQFLREDRGGNISNLGLQETNSNALFNTSNVSSSRLVQNPQMPTTTPAASTANTTTLTSASSLKIYTKGKFRSHSVPTISHSSLRKLTSCNKHSHYHYHNNINTTHHSHNHHHHHISALSNHPLVGSGGIKKKKFVKSSHHHNNHCIVQEKEMKGAPKIDTQISSNDKKIASAGPNEVFMSENVAKSNISNTHSNSSLRNAILLCHHARPAVIRYQDLPLEERINAIKTKSAPIPLPPINLQCLKEIELQEIVKNPQLRHDIIFDPLLQFRPNLDGERGVKKKQLADKYWNDVENEIYVYSERPDVFDYNHTRLVPLFNTLREVLLTIVPQREAHVINNVLDTELNVQELLKGSLIMSNLSEWLAQLFKHHCAPMRDAWVDKMKLKFKQAEEESCLSKLIEGLRLVFQILEAMKLDIANHQIRILRTALLSNSVEFEKQYFQSLMSSNRVNLKSSLLWFNKKFDESESSGTIIKGQTTARDIYKLCIRSIISLLSCRKMVREYPNSLSFDHARLILLRADIRQIVCLLVCRLLFKQLVANDTTLDKSAKEFINASFTTKRLKEEIVSIITDEHGNCRWTKNITSIAIHLCKTIQDLKNEHLGKENNSANKGFDILSSTTSLDTVKVDFAKSWLSKQTQPLSEVYGVLENRVFKSLEDSIFSKSGCTIDGRVKQDFVYLCSTNAANTGTGTGTGTGTSSTTTGISANNSTAMMTPPRDGSTRGLMNLQSPNTTSAPFNSNNAHLTSPSIVSSSTTISGSDNTFQGLEMEVFENVYRHLYTVVNFHWSVFGCHYLDSLSDKIENIAQ